MGIKANFTSVDVANMLKARSKSIEQAILMRLTMLGERCVNTARSSSDYTDRTGNLRSSIGYVVMANGKQVKGNFLSSIKGEEGEHAARSLAELISSRFATGYALIVVAGMDYAYYVESTGRDVLSSAEHYAETHLPTMLRQLTKKLKS